MALYSYAIMNDLGFAPNPWGRYCTLATCKPDVRRCAEVGDWIIGTAGHDLELYGVAWKRLVYAMEVWKKVQYTEYDQDPRFNYKKPDARHPQGLNGDNIYFRGPDGKPVRRTQSPHHASAEDQNRDLRGRGFVLIAKRFWYFGANAVEVPRHLRGYITNGVGHLPYDAKAAEAVKNWLEATYEPGVWGFPTVRSLQASRYSRSIAAQIARQRRPFRTRLTVSESEP